MKSKARIFDLDRTLIRKNLSFGFYFYLMRQGIVSRATLVRTIPLFFNHFWGRIGLIDIHHHVFQHVLKGLKLTELEAMADRFVVPYVNRWLNPAMLDALNEAKKEGEKVYLLSSSTHWLVERVSRMLGFDAFRGTQYSIDKEGRLCDISSLVTGPMKLEIAKQWASGDCHSIVYTDSVDDLLLLEWAKCPVAVNPDRFLRKIAQGRGWSIVR